MAKMSCIYFTAAAAAAMLPILFVPAIEAHDPVNITGTGISDHINAIAPWTNVINIVCVLALRDIIYGIATTKAIFSYIVPIISSTIIA